MSKYPTPKVVDTLRHLAEGAILERRTEGSRSYTLVATDGQVLGYRDTGEVLSLWRRSWVEGDNNPDDGGRFEITGRGRTVAAEGKGR